jgi:hypothetical protein
MILIRFAAIHAARASGASTLGHDDQPRAIEQGRPNLERRCVERNRRSLRDGVVRTDCDIARIDDETLDPAMRVTTPFGIPVEPDV